MLATLDRIPTLMSATLNNECGEPLFLVNGVYLSNNDVRPDFSFGSVVPADILSLSPEINPKFWQSSTDVFMHTDDFKFPKESPNTLAIPLDIQSSSEIFLIYKDNGKAKEVKLATGQPILFNAKQEHGLIDRSKGKHDDGAQFHINWIIFDRVCPSEKIKKITYIE